MSSVHHVAVIMATYNGVRHLRPQLESIFAQQGVCPHLYVRDDSSTDDTVRLIVDYATGARVPIHVLTAGSEGNVGTYESWRILLRTVPRRFDYYSICDQDDVWMPGKLAAGVGQLGLFPDVPALYTCNTTAVTDDMSVIHRYDFTKMTLSLPSLFARYSIPAHSMMFNLPLMALVDLFDAADTPEAFTLEQCLALGVLAVGGQWTRDCVSYVNWRRQPGANVTAAGGGLRRRIVFELSRFVERGVRTSWARALLETPGIAITAEARAFLVKVLEAEGSLRGRVALSVAPELSTGRALFDLMARTRVLLPDW